LTAVDAQIAGRRCAVYVQPGRRRKSAGWQTKVGCCADKTQNITGIFKNSSDIFTNSIEISTNINDILSLIGTAAERFPRSSRVGGAPWLGLFGAPTKLDANGGWV
jgi:hypothetical protein